MVNYLLNGAYGDGPKQALWRAVWTVPMVCVLTLGCGQREGLDPSLKFTGSWTVTFAGRPAERFDAIADGRRFHITRQTPGALPAGAKVQIFDGRRYYEHDSRIPVNRRRNYLRSTVGQDLDGYRFWWWRPSGDSMEGEAVLGRATRLYQSEDPVLHTQEKRWIDKETGILLRSELLDTRTWKTHVLSECQSIRFTVDDPAVFKIITDDQLISNL
jgi:hypothetical protein